MKTEASPQIELIHELPDLVFSYRALSEHVGHEHPLTQRLENSIQPVIEEQITPAEIEFTPEEKQLIFDSLKMQLITKDKKSLDYAHAKQKLQDGRVRHTSGKKPKLTHSVAVNDFSNVDVFDTSEIELDTTNQT